MSITDVPGLRVGHWTNLEAGTGCTVVLCESGALAGVDVRGAAPATRETELLRPGSLVGRANAILLSGGSAFGLDAASGVMRYLEERGIGFATGQGPVPIVPAAALFDLSLGRADIRPDAEAGYAACEAASTSVEEGCVGAGTGATVAKMGGPANAIKGGIGTASTLLPNGTIVAALVAVNAVGAIHDHESGETIARPRGAAGAPIGIGTNTTIGLIATTAPLDPGSINRLATVAHDGIALAIRPAHTMFDGDALFALSLPHATADPVDPLLLGQAVVSVVAAAVVRGVRSATSLHGIPAAYQ
ncbi:MAG TPA: P1 family peptidase [Chloroflexota bacterium]|nr:P1 family peptidase [Chloroflexota bacterium]